MKSDTPELLFSSREDFRKWLSDNAQTSEGVWLVFGKTKAVATLTANEALEEALCFGWIDEQIESLAERLHEISPAYENFMKMSPSVKRTYTGAYFAPKSEDARQRGFDRIVDRLNKNLKPM